MKLREFIQQETDVDVCDDYDEGIYIAFVGPMKLTKHGEEYFKPIMEIDVDFDPEFPDFALLKISDEYEKENFAKHYVLLRRLFYYHAGYCDDFTWNSLFLDVD